MLLGSNLTYFRGVAAPTPFPGEDYLMEERE